MVEVNSIPAYILQSLETRHLAAGLIHNINTPLNLIMGYAQQLKKQHPEIAALDKIYNAALTVDELLHNCTHQAQCRAYLSLQSFFVGQWLRDEVLFLSNVLLLKHNIQILPSYSPDDFQVHSCPLLLSMLLEGALLISLGDERRDEQKQVCEIKLIQLDNMATLQVSGFIWKETLSPLGIDTLLHHLEQAYAVVPSGLPFTVNWDKDTLTILIPMAEAS